MNFTWTRIIYIIVLAALWACQQESTSDERPNILFIMSDDHTSQAWGIYGGILADYVQNEHIRRLADEGAVLENVFCTNSICTPSRAAILSGKYSHLNGVYTLSEAYEPDSANIAKLMQANGYQTAIVGKWHLKKEPTGFDYYMVLPGQGRYYNPILKTKENWEDYGKGGKVYEGFSADVIADKTIEWLRQRDDNKPFMMMCHFKATHEPFGYPERLANLYQDQEIPEPETLYDFGPETNGRGFEGQQLWILGERYVNDSQDPTNKRYPGPAFSLAGLDSIAARKKTYQKFVKDFMRSGAAIDENIGKLLAYLDEAGLSKNTIVIYTADQGYFLGEHGFFDKRMIYEEALRMPFVIRYPREIPAGSRIDAMVLNIDFPALFADYAGIKNLGIMKSMQGKSFRKILAGESINTWRDNMYYRYWLHQTNRPAHFGIRTNRYKLAFFYGQPLQMSGAHEQATAPFWEFYDLQKDPGENDNAYEDEVYADLIAEMKEVLLIEKERVGDTESSYPMMESIIANHWE